MVIQQPITFADKKLWYLHKNLRAIDHNLLLSQLTPICMHRGMKYFFMSQK